MKQVLKYIGKFVSTDIMELVGVVLFSIASFFVSFRIFNFTLIRLDGKFCIKKFKIAGTGGQCLLTPPERALEEIPTALYNAVGVVCRQRG